MNGRSELCVCGHDIATHFLDQTRPGDRDYVAGKEPKKFRGACTGAHCDDCKRYTPAEGKLRVA
jgi:hypothetical protein